MELSTTSLPTNFYVVVGVLVVANLSVLISVITFIFKAGMFVSTTKAGIEDAKSTAVRAHKRIDKLAGEGEE